MRTRIRPAIQSPSVNRHPSILIAIIIAFIIAITIAFTIAIIIAFIIAFIVAGLYFSVPPASEWNTDADGAYFHYTSADTRQGLEIRDFDFAGVPDGMPICCDVP